MPKGERSEGATAERPLLSGGELLTTKGDRPGRNPDEKYHPLSPEDAHKLLEPQARQLMADLQKLPGKLKARHVVVEATLQPNYLASSYFPSDLLDRNDLYVIGTRQTRLPLRTKTKVVPAQITKTLIIAGEETNVLRLAGLVAGGPKASPREWEQIREFNDLGLPRPERVIVSRPDLAPGEVITWESVLSTVGQDDRQRAEWSDEATRKWTSWVESLGGEVAADYERRVGTLTFVPVALHAEALDEAARFNLLRAIRPMPKVRPFPESILRAFGKPVPPCGFSEPVSTDVQVAVFDGGFPSQSPYFAPFAKLVNVTSEPPEPRYMAHGTLVTSALLYGVIDPGQPLPRPIAPVVHYRVFPIPAHGGSVDTELYWVLDRMKERIRDDKLTLVSCSLGPDECVDEHQEPCRWTAELDELVHSNGVTFLSAVGNNGEEDAQLGYNRVQAPGDMVNGIGVGACCASTEDKPLVRAPYSAVGPGREGQRVQPTGVAFGGWTAEPFLGVDGTGQVRASMGTSFAAPTTTRGIADLFRTVEAAHRRPEVARVFATHFATRRRGHKAVELGHGRLPELYEGVWKCAANEATVFYDQQLIRGVATGIRFALPTGLMQDVKATVEWTICFSTEVDQHDAVDYTRCGLEVIFRPHGLLRSVRPKKPKNAPTTILHLHRHKAEIEEAYVKGWLVSDAPPAHSAWKTYKSERVLRGEGKWETVMRGHVCMAVDGLHEPRLDVTYLRRAGGALVASGPEVAPLRIAVLATIRLPEGVVLYDLVQSQFSVLTPLVTLPIEVAA